MDLGIVIAYFGNATDTVINDNETWMVCDGREISRQDYDDLYGIIDDTYGQGDNETTFNIPDLRGYFVRGLDITKTPIRDPDVDSRTAMNVGGNTGASVGSVEQPQTGPHMHTLSGWVCVQGCCPFSSNHDIVDLNPNDSNTAFTDVTGGPEVTPKNAYVNYLILVKRAS
jgi:microcystin-dependent protein